MSCVWLSNPIAESWKLTSCKVAPRSACKARVLFAVPEHYLRLAPGYGLFFVVSVSGSHRRDVVRVAGLKRKWNLAILVVDRYLKAFGLCSLLRSR